MSTLLLRLAGPLQSWGYRSRFTDRDTALEPTKSGVVGLLCCALGRDRSESPADLAAMRMHVRVDREGALLTDFHTAGGGRFRGSAAYFAPTSAGGHKTDPTVTQRHYLQDASFLVALEGDEGLLLLLRDRLADPEWPLALGRRSCPPGEAVLADLASGAGEEALREFPWRVAAARLPKRWDEAAGAFVEDRAPRRLRLIIECQPGDLSGEARPDVPVAWADPLDRRYALRWVRTGSVEKAPEVEA